MQNLISENQKEFINSYLHTASWVTCDSGENTEFTKEAKERAASDCKVFIEKVFSAFDNETAERLLNISGNDISYVAAMDFFLTRNHHGAGFWDSENIYGESEAKILTEISESMRQVDCAHIRGKKSKLTFD